MRVFLDFEASSLSKDSYPIEVGWVLVNGEAEAHLIRPAHDWTDWDDEAALTHGISRDTLLSEGQAPKQVAERMIEALTPHELFASAPSWDGKWLSVLLRGAGFPRHQLRLRDTQVVFEEAARARLGDGATGQQVSQLIEAARAISARQPTAHRALADAQRERQIWQLIATGQV